MKSIHVWRQERGGLDRCRYCGCARMQVRPIRLTGIQSFYWVRGQGWMRSRPQCAPKGDRSAKATDR